MDALEKQYELAKLETDITVREIIGDITPELYQKLLRTIAVFQNV